MDIWYWAKLFGCILLIIAAYYFYHMIIRVLYLRYKYSKYPNVFMTKKFNPVLGDISQCLDLIDQNKCMMYIMKQLGVDKVGDLWLNFAGYRELFYAQSLEAAQQFYDNVPKNIDRGEEMLYFVSKLTRTGFEVHKSTDDWKRRRTTFTKLIGINHSSKYIPLMISIAKEYIKNLHVGDDVDFSKDSATLMYTIISKILFGKDIDIFIQTIDYISNDGSIVKMSLADFFAKLNKDLIDHYIHPFAMLLPILNKNSLAKPFSTDYKNITEFRRVLKEFLGNTKDTESFYSSLKEHTDVKDDEAFVDLITFLVAGTDTSAHLLCNSLYLLQKHPDSYQKLMQEIDEHFESNLDEFTSSEFMTRLDKCDYLNYVIKEVLRIDPPTYEPIDYETKNDVVICGVPIPKNTPMSVNLMALHLDPDQWRDPLKFIPERFDPTSEYFTTPAGKNRHPLSYIPFSVGLRNCAGQTLAKLESKVMLVYVLKHMKFDIDKELIENEYMSFMMMSQFKLKFKIVELN